MDSLLVKDHDGAIERALGWLNERHRNTFRAAFTLARLCVYFGCRIEELVEHVPER